MDQLVAEDLFEIIGDRVTLIGGRCHACSAVAFPRPSSCTRCRAEAVAEYRLPTEGVLWTFTVQSFRPKPPYDGLEDFSPFGVGYVSFGDEVLVEGQLTESDPNRLQIGMSMRAVPHAYAVDEEGSSIVTFAFAPIGGI